MVGELATASQLPTCNVTTIFEFEVQTYSTMSASERSGSPPRGPQPVLASQRAKQAPGPPIKTTYFPLGYKAGISQWWVSVSPAIAEHNVLGFIPHLQKPPTRTQTGSAPVTAHSSSSSINPDSSRESAPVRTNSINDPYGPRSWHSNLVKLSGRERALNEFSVQRDGEEVEENLVMLHGYGAGLGFFYKNFEGLSRLKGWKIYALDMLGMGRSSRPHFRIHAKDQAGKISEAENWFIDALEEWRILKKIDKFTLLGHSMGGYMAVAYALKYPGHLNKLILASPVGIPEDPYAMKVDMPEPVESTMTSEFTQDQEDDIANRRPNGDNNNFMNARSKAEESNNTKEPARRPLPKWLTYLWDANISPFSIVRWSGPFGPRFVSGWTSRRFSHLPENESEVLHAYAYSLFRQKGSGEYALAYILAPGAFARSPLIRRIQGVGRQPILPPTQPTPSTSRTTSSSTLSTTSQTAKKETGFPVVLMYGEHDWMDIAGGFAAEQKLKEEKEKVLKCATDEEKKQENGSAKVLVIKKAGHHLYLDGWEEFNVVMREEMAETSRHTKESREYDGFEADIWS
ncbi:Alpha/Beta hydrolase protein [Amylocarpus encephaloides]|uniref:Alpha/Beta hydrolase protein n=1 Tax=Amylocarpus encephaloides TaxID=45428 RepID=A0A9P7Y650_9HELO|nr:Alpha/Beta hydrolase protein [Amylocarpus encephaloides]